MYVSLSYTACYYNGSTFDLVMMVPCMVSRIFLIDCILIVLSLVIIFTADNNSAAYLIVGGEKVYLEEGKCVVFDDSFVHEAGNTSPSEPRVVLVVDFWHPDFTDPEVW